MLFVLSVLPSSEMTNVTLSCTFVIFSEASSRVFRIFSSSLKTGMTTASRANSGSRAHKLASPLVKEFFCNPAVRLVICHVPIDSPSQPFL